MRHGERRDAEPGRGERRADRARVQDEVTGVRAGVDPRRNDLGPFAERTEAREVHRSGRGSLDRDHGNVGQLRPVPIGNGNRLGSVERTDRRTRAAQIRCRGNDEHVVAGVVKGAGERHDPR